MIVGDVKLDNRNHIKSLVFRSYEEIYFLEINILLKIDIYSKILLLLNINMLTQITNFY
ncbi:hypothetical protein PMI13_03274 [Chryseobacterium populi]|uniref:Uncharacterized protein n=1 Tax=Chryseobacterium populi TaxID=1144316 RepID=J3CDD3_9FLAO|nr:hypothetical protein PMI13_03274 [Chryseobacterium populi]